MKASLILSIFLGLAESSCRAKPKIPNTLLASYPSNHCFRGGVEAWVTYTNFPPCWIYIQDRQKWDCYNFELDQPGQCPPFPGIKKIGQ